MSQNQVKILIAAIAIFLILSVLFYFRNDLVNFGKLNKKTGNTTSQHSLVKPKDYSHPVRQILVQSGVKGYKIILFNEMGLVNILEKQNIYGRRYVTNYKTTSGIKPLNDIQLYIRDDIQSRNPDYGDNVFFYFSEGVMKVNIVVDPSKFTDIRFGDKILSTFLKSVYFVVYNTTSEKELEDKVNELLEDARNEGIKMQIIKL